MYANKVFSSLCANLVGRANWRDNERRRRIYACAAAIAAAATTSTSLSDSWPLNFGIEVVSAKEDESRRGGKQDGENISHYGESEAADIRNWSDTHAISCEKFHLPQSTDEVELLVKHANERNERLRPCGNVISPNGGAMSEKGMISMKMVRKIGVT